MPLRAISSRAAQTSRVRVSRRRRAPRPASPRRAEPALACPELIAPREYANLTTVSRLMKSSDSGGEPGVAGDEPMASAIASGTMRAEVAHGDERPAEDAVPRHRDRG